MGLVPMFPHCLRASKYMTAAARVQLALQPVGVNGQLVHGLNGLAGYLQLTSVLDQPCPTAHLFYY
jgi:hypothetical protein